MICMLRKSGKQGHCAQHNAFTCIHSPPLLAHNFSKDVSRNVGGLLYSKLASIASDVTGRQNGKDITACTADVYVQ